MNERQKLAAALGLALGMMAVGIAIIVVSQNVVLGGGLIAAGAFMMAIRAASKTKNG